MAKPWLTRIVASLTAEGAFECRPFYLRSVVCEVAVGQVFVSVLPSLLVSIIPPMIHNLLFYTLFLLEGQTGEGTRWILRNCHLGCLSPSIFVLGRSGHTMPTFTQRIAVSDIGETWVITGICFFFFLFLNVNSKTVDEF